MWHQASTKVSGFNYGLSLPLRDEHRGHRIFANWPLQFFFCSQHRLMHFTRFWWHIRCRSMSSVASFSPTSYDYLRWAVCLNKNSCWKSLLSIDRYFQGRAGFYRKLVSSLVWLGFSEGTVTTNGNKKRDIIPLLAIRFRPMQELKMDDFPGGCTNPLKCHGTLSCTSLNKSYFYPGVRSHYLHAFLPLPTLLELALPLKTLQIFLDGNLPWLGIQNESITRLQMQSACTTKWHIHVKSLSLKIAL